jgi:hypothetical protein
MELIVNLSGYRCDKCEENKGCCGRPREAESRRREPRVMEEGLSKRVQGKHRIFPRNLPRLGF